MMAAILLFIDRLAEDRKRSQNANTPGRLQHRFAEVVACGKWLHACSDALRSYLMRRICRGGSVIGDDRYRTISRRVLLTKAEGRRWCNKKGSSLDASAPRLLARHTHYLEGFDTLRIYCCELLNERWQ
jgi:hypothetical protein